MHRPQAETNGHAAGSPADNFTKKRHDMRVSWLNLHEKVPQRDVRKIIYGMLTSVEMYTVSAAHGCKKLAQCDVRVCISNNYVELYKWFVEKDVHAVMEQDFLDCVLHGRAEILEWLFEIRPDVMKLTSSNRAPFRLAHHVARHANVAIAEVCNHNHAPFSTNTMIAAAYSGNLEVLKYLRALEVACGFEITSWDFGWSAHVNVNKWLAETFPHSNFSYENIDWHFSNCTEGFE